MSDTPRWDENGTNSAEPPEQYKTDGLPEGVPLPYTYLNWILAQVARGARTAPRLLHANTDVSNQVVNTAAETDFGAADANQYTMPAGTIDEGIAQLRIRVGLDYSIAAPCNLTIRLYIGGGTFGIVVFPVTANGHATIDFDLTLITPGAVANGPYRTLGISDEGNEVTTGQSANVDTTAANLIKVSAQFSVMDAGNDVVMNAFDVALAQGIGT